MTCPADFLECGDSSPLSFSHGPLRTLKRKAMTGHRTPKKAPSPLFGFVACLVFGLAASAGAEEPGHFRFWRDVDRGPAKEEAILSFTLDSDIYAATRDGLPDLRIFDNAQTETPYQIESDVEYREERIRHSGHPEDVSLREKGNAIEIGLRLPKDSPAAEGFVFVTPQVDYERKVQVFGSNDGMNWSTLVADGTIFDFSRYMDVSNREVALPPNAFRQFKIVVEDATDEKQSPYKELTRTFRSGKEEERKESTTLQRRVFRIDRIEFFWHTVQQHVKKARKAEYAVVRFDKEIDAQKKQTILQVHTRREPLTAFTIETPSRNFNRRLTVEVPVVRGPTTQWNAIGQGTLSNFRFRTYHREHVSVQFPEQRQDQYRVVIDNEDNPPLDITGVKAEGNVYREIFLAQEEKSFRVYYGAESVESPKYEAATVLSTLRESFSPTRVQLGAQVDNASFGEEPGFTVRNALNNWIFLGAVICLMVIVLAWGLFRAGKQLENLPKE
jgi:hypothetical protein